MARLIRIDSELVRRGLARSRTHAATLISDGHVTLDGEVVTKPARQVNPAQAIEILVPSGDDYVSRGAHKLAGALDALGQRGLAPRVEGRRCLDAGASTGGFTDVLLRRGAEHVVSVDVGYGQLAWSLRCDPRVTALDRTNIRTLDPAAVAPAPELVVGDLSFISLTLVLEPLLRAAADDADLVLLPAITGLKDAQLSEELRRKVKVQVKFVATMPPSVPGIRTLELMRKRLYALGGSILIGDKAVEGRFEDGKIVEIKTAHLTEETLTADNFILATGSFMSQGLISDYTHVFEPVFGLDVKSLANRNDWYNENVFRAQPYMNFGVTTDADLHAMKDGKIIENLFVTGSILSGHNNIKFADGEGVSMLTALYAAKKIVK